MIYLVDSAIQRLNNRGQINYYPVDKYWGNQLRYPAFEQLGPGVLSSDILNLTMLFGKRNPVDRLKLKAFYF